MGIKETLVNNKQQPLTPLLCPPERPSSPDQPTPESLLSEPSETDLEPPCLEASRFSSQRRSTRACPTCQTSPTRRSPSRLTTLNQNVLSKEIETHVGVGFFGLFFLLFNSGCSFTASSRGSTTSSWSSTS